MAKRVTRLGGLLAAYQRRDPAARSKLEIFLLYPGVHAVLYHRVAHWLYAFIGGIPVLSYVVCWEKAVFPRL